MTFCTIVNMLSEFDLIKKYFTRPTRAGSGVQLGVGDDCALIAPVADQSLAISTDMLVEGRHFLPDADPASLGHKALAVNLSDLAAMGAKPLGFTLALALPDADEAWLDAFAHGLFALADAEQIELIGGDTTRGDGWCSLCSAIVISSSLSERLFVSISSPSRASPKLPETQISSPARAPSRRRAA